MRRRSVVTSSVGAQVQTGCGEVEPSRRVWRERWRISSGVPSWLSGWGLALLLFALLALFCPGGIDIIDGEVRYEVAKSILDYGDSAIRNEGIWFSVFPGRDGQRYTYYRLPHSLLGAAALWVADSTGGLSEPRRQFFFTLLSPLCGALLAAAYFVWFSRYRPTRSPLLWAAAGVLCTPCWYYSTSTFDDMFGATTMVWSIVIIGAAARNPSTLRALASGLLIGVAFNFKQPVAVFAMPAAALLYQRQDSVRRWLMRCVPMCVGLGVGLVVYILYDLWKFPPGTKALHGPLLEWYMPVWPGQPGWALFALALSPAAGILWYCPTLPLCVSGVKKSWNDCPCFVTAAVWATAVFFLFIASISFFKGDPAWGPRYLVPAFAILWLFAPMGAAAWPKLAVAALLVVGLTVQLLGLAVDPQRLYIERRLPNMFGAMAPALLFDPPNAHLLQRPREILEIWRARYDSGERFSPGEPTFSFPIVPMTETGPDALRKYKMLNVFRPWWASYDYLPPEYRPVSRAAALGVYAIVALVGAVLIIWGRALSKRAGESLEGCCRRDTLTDS